MKVAAYARFSTDLQDKTSIAAQFANCEALVAREGFTIVARFSDEARQGSDDGRPGYQAMLAALKRGDFQGIVADETSRITRNPAELHRLVAELRFRDQFLITADGIDTRSETSEIVLSVRAAIDSMESKRIGYRVYRSLKERHKDGHSAGGRVYGYTSVEDGGYRRRVVDPEQAAIVREIFERYANGETAKMIAADLNARGVPSPGSYWNNRVRRANGWMHTTILGGHTKPSGILRNTTYVGRPTWNKRAGKRKPGTASRLQKRRPDTEWITVQDESLRIVSDELWNRVQARLRAVKDAHPQGGRPNRYLLSGLLKCGCCGASYVMANDRNYRCSSQTNGRAVLCTQRRVINRRRAEERLLAGIKAELLAPKAITAMAKAVRARLREMEQPAKGPLQKELARVERELANVADAIAKVGGSATLLGRLRDLEAEKGKLAGQIALVDKPPRVMPNVEKALRERVKALEQIPADAEAGQIERARAAVQSYIGPVRIVEDGEHVVAEVDIGRWYITHGAEEALPDLYTKRIVLT